MTIYNVNHSDPLNEAIVVRVRAFHYAIVICPNAECAGNGPHRVWRAYTRHGAIRKAALELQLDTPNVETTNIGVRTVVSINAKQ